ncbi:MAG TPA: terminase gpA endonuclease subunit, partial [Polyangiaceae bacterium]
MPYGGERGPFTLDRAPFVREVLRMVRHPDVEEITLCFAAQIAKTLICQLVVLYYMAEEPDECLHVMAKKDDAVSLNCDRYQKIVRASPRLAGFLTGAAHDMTREAIRFTNGSALHFASAQSPSDLASRTIRILILDETDKFVEFSGKEADPIALAMERTERRTDRKILKASTPTTDRGYINQEFLQGDRRRFHVPCPHCGVYQVLYMPGIKWPEGERDPDRILDQNLAWYECGACAGRINDLDKVAMLRRGVWCPETMKVNEDGELEGEAPPLRRLSYHLSRLYSTSSNHTFSRIAAQFLRNHKFPSKLMNFRNSWLAEVWEDKVEEVTAAHVRERVGGYIIGTVPSEAHVLTAGVDVQLDHLWYVIRAWGAYGESWLVRQGRVEDWEALHLILFDSRYMAGPDPIALKCVL